MDATNQQQSVQGTGLQNTQELQQGQQGSLQPQSNFKQLQQDALGSDAYRNFDGLRVQQGAADTGTRMPMPQHYRTTLNAWPAAWVFTTAVIAFIIFVNFKNGTKPKASTEAAEHKAKGASIPVVAKSAASSKTSKPKAKKTAHKVVKKKKSAKKGKK